MCEGVHQDKVSVKLFYLQEDFGGQLSVSLIFLIVCSLMI